MYNYNYYNNYRPYTYPYNFYYPFVSGLGNLGNLYPFNLLPFYFYNPNNFRGFYNSYDPFIDIINSNKDADYINSLIGKNSLELKDYGADPMVMDINDATQKNANFRTTLWTGKHLQVTLMNINPKEDIGLEIHPDTDQFIRIESGKGLVKMGISKNNLNFQRNISDDDVILIPANTWHNIINTTNIPLKLYSIYAPPHHKPGTIHETKKDAID